ncbi:MAG TPA: hypothetical protein VE548_07215 [Nitrososphaeraceae archaeon]|nr:hypothetical protein [Nitrososphaeraceae archaeon]
MSKAEYNLARCSELTDAHEVRDDIKIYLRENLAYVFDYFMRIKDLVNLEWLS